MLEYGAGGGQVLLTTVLSIGAACLGLVAGICFCIGSIRLSPSEIRQVAATKYGYNPHVVRSLAGQKAEYGAGALLLSFSFLLQLGALGVNPTTALSLPQNWLSVLCLALAILLPTALAAYGLRQFLYAKTTRAVPGYKPLALQPPPKK